jgi:outer membrane biosynthesis protein TonB
MFACTDVIIPLDLLIEKEDVMSRSTSVIIILAVVFLTASCASNRPVEKPEIAGETPAKAEPLKKPAPPEAVPDPEPPRVAPEEPKEPEEAPEKPSEAPAAQPQEAAAEMTKEEYEEMAAIGRMITQAHMMYQQYFQKKAQTGAKDAALLKSAIATYDAVISKLQALLKKYPDSPDLQMYMGTATEQRRALLWE